MTGKSYLDSLKDVYLSGSKSQLLNQRVLSLVCDYVVERLPKESSRVLELGVGELIWTPKLLEKYESVTSVDGSADLLGAMKEKLATTELAHRWEPVVSMFEDYEPEEPFDLVLATYVLEHVDDPHLIVRRARERWVRAGGHLAVVVPHALSLHRRLGVHMGLQSHPAELGEADRSIGHKHCFTYPEVESMMSDSEFKVCDMKGFFTKPLPNQLLSDCSDQQLKGLFDLGLELPIEYAGIIYFVGEAV